MVAPFVAGFGHTRNPDPADGAEGAMIVERLWPGNAYRNFHYLIACAETGEALAVDPLDYALCARVARERGFTITQILNTHEHLDHTGGNDGLRAVTGARVLAHAGAATTIGGVASPCTAR